MYMPQMENSAPSDKFAENIELRNRNIHPKFEKAPILIILKTYVEIFIFLFNYIRKCIFNIGNPKQEKNREGYPPLFGYFDSFITYTAYQVLADCLNRPISSTPGTEIVIKDRIKSENGRILKFTGTYTKCVNTGSYNYLGFGESDGPCSASSIKIANDLGVGVCSPSQELGTMAIHKRLEKYIARFLGTEDAIIISAGFATNALNLPSIFSKGCLVMSDEKNHASIVLGLRLSGAEVCVFKHNDTKDLETKLRQAVITGQPRTSRPWRKIAIVVEGIYSVEGSFIDLPGIISLKKKYKAYLYMDEAHSIGAIGPNGRGVVDYFGCNPQDIDIHMGTFSKSFASVGGYIAGKKELINHLRIHSHASCYGTAMSPPAAQQAIAAIRIIMGEDGTNEGQRRLMQLSCNTRYFRKKLCQIGLIVYGSQDSPVVPVLVFKPTKLGAMSRELLKRGIAAVIVGYPAVGLAEARCRFCISACHSKEMLDKVIDAMTEIADLLGVKYSRLPHYSLDTIVYE